MGKILCLKSPIFSYKNPTICNNFYREFLVRLPTNTRVFPISGMIFIRKWRYPPTFFRDCFHLRNFFFEGIPLLTSHFYKLSGNLSMAPATKFYQWLVGVNSKDSDKGTHTENLGVELFMKMPTFCWVLWLFAIKQHWIHWYLFWIMHWFLDQEMTTSKNKYIPKSLYTTHQNIVYS